MVGRRKVGQSQRGSLLPSDPARVQLFIDMFAPYRERKAAEEMARKEKIREVQERRRSNSTAPIPAGQRKGSKSERKRAAIREQDQ